MAHSFKRYLCLIGFDHIARRQIGNGFLLSLRTGGCLEGAIKKYSIRLLTVSPHLHTKDYYRMLGVKHTASNAEIKQAYLEAAKLHHPDSTGHTDRLSNRKFHEISEAYEVLGDKKKKMEYDITVGHKYRTARLDRYAAHTRNWHRESSIHYHRKDKIDEHFKKEDENYPTTTAEYTTFIYCAAVGMFGLYVLYVFNT